MTENLPEDIVHGELRDRATKLMLELLKEFDYAKIDTSDNDLLYAFVAVANDYGAELHNRVYELNPVNWAAFWKFTHEQGANAARQLLEIKKSEKATY